MTDAEKNISVKMVPPLPMISEEPSNGMTGTHGHAEGSNVQMINGWKGIKADERGSVSGSKERISLPEMQSMEAGDEGISMQSKSERCNDGSKTASILITEQTGKDTKEVHAAASRFNVHKWTTLQSQSPTIDTNIMLQDIHYKRLATLLFFKKKIVSTLCFCMYVFMCVLFFFELTQLVSDKNQQSSEDTQNNKKNDTTHSNSQQVVIDKERVHVHTPTTPSTMLSTSPFQSHFHPSHSHLHSNSHSHSHSHSHSYSHSHAHQHAHSHLHAHSYSHSRSQYHTQAVSLEVPQLSHPSQVSEEALHVWIDELEFEKTSKAFANTLKHSCQDSGILTLPDLILASNNQVGRYVTHH
ncbi:hypothetical protein RFI_14835 [Reticulomyxa filosa]|uniref:Uncharacterized protein n=1 Tax=Reticulomyxa filosa TaxID=46433 RepID=X6N8L6_RETFI|nr:hypothetical protein RFI_14835 [Reticulomyxa filosa]|eukprot:ETO22361.1 hypothetical protein RFI_14835 [Reticulomyxa filosa]